MERGVVIGGLMICGSFLLAAMLNRSAMKEVPAPAAAAPIEAGAPLAPASVQPATTPVVTACAEVNTRADAHSTTAEAEPAKSDLMVNGREGCPR